MTLLRLVHRVIGLALAVPIILVSLSGGLLLLRDPYYRARFPALARPHTSTEHARRAEMLAHIETAFAPAAVRVVRFPRPGINAFHVYLDDGSEAFVHPGTGVVISRWRWSTSAPAFLFDLHAHLLMGASGETVNGLAALTLMFLGLTGIVLWYPRRRAFRLRRPMPARWSPGELLRSHSVSGVLVLGPVLLFAATGTALVFYQPVSAIVASALDRQPALEPSAKVAPTTAPRRPWVELLTAVDGALPEAGPAMYYPGNGTNAVLTFRKSLPGEWHPNGRSYILVNPYTARVEQTIDARAQGAGTRAMHAMYPLHAARVGRWILVPLATLAAVALAWLAISGGWSYVGRLRASRARGRAMATARRYAPFSTFNGSSRAARHAGTRQATVATPSKTSGTTA